MLRRFHLKAEQRSVLREVALPNGSSLGAIPKHSDGQPVRILEDQERAAQVRQALAQLNDTDYEILVMRTFEALSNQEAAEALGVDPATACKRYGRALLHLREKLTANGFRHEE
jgi:RNA polymerase sigma-70 factor (ECF subfamily)